jgi:hypothetical protein
MKDDADKIARAMVRAKTRETLIIIGIIVVIAIILVIVFKIFEF